MRVAVMFMAVFTAACSSVVPDAGQQAVLTKKPWFFGAGGVDPVPVQTGRAYVALSTSATYVDVRPRQQEVSFDDLFTMDGVPLDFQAAIQYQITDAVKLVKDFGADDSEHGMGFFRRTLDQKFRQIVRDAVKKRGLNEMAISVTAAQAVDAEVTEEFDAVVSALGVPIKLISVTLGRANPPDAIKHQRVATAEQEQRSNTEKQRKLAEDQRLAAEQSRAAADNAYREAMRLSPEQFLQLEAIKMQRDVCVGGKCQFFLGAGVVPTLPVR